MDIWLPLSTIFQGIALASLTIGVFLGLCREFRVKRKKIKKKLLSIIHICLLTTAFFTFISLVSLVVASDNFCV